jgi:mannose-6-phosphate isomerase
LADLLSNPKPPEGLIGEAWLLSDRQDRQSRVADGPLSGWTLRQLLEKFPEEVMGPLSPLAGRFPLLLKFLDAREMLSVQVHPSDDQTAYLPADETGKTEAWLVLDAAPQSRIYAGLVPGTTPESLRESLRNGTLSDQLASFVPKPGEGILLPAGTVHALGGGALVFEVQQNSDVTFRLYDWDRLDATTGERRALQAEEAIACTDFAQGALGPVAPVVETTTPVTRERLFDCEHFCVWRNRGQELFDVGAPGVTRLLVCTEGSGSVEYAGETYDVRAGDVVLLPAVVGRCTFRPTAPVNLLEIALPRRAGHDGTATRR